MKKSLFILLALLSCTLFTVTAQDTNITTVEYYIDTDPGVGAGTSISITAGTPQNINLNIPTGSLSTGFHVLVVRALDASGRWGIQNARPFYVSPLSVSTQATITTLEYYFDSDPGFGSGNPITISAATTLSLQSMVSTASLSRGFHSFNIRAQDSDGAWGIPFSVAFYLDNVGQINAIEYFIDNDPGIGSATQVPVSPAASSIDQNVAVATSSLANGNYTLGMRIGDTNGNYSFTQTSSFTVCSSASASFTVADECQGNVSTFTDTSTGVLAGDVYSWDFDGDGSEDSNTTGNTSFTYPTPGSYTATLSIDRSGCISTFSMPVNIGDPASANAGADQSSCGSTPVSLTGTIGTTSTNPTWATSGTGSFSDPNLPVSNYTPSAADISAGSVTLTLTADGTGVCPSVSDQLTLTISPAPLAGSLSISNNVLQTTNIDVLANSTIAPTDVITLMITQAPAKGTAAVQSDNTINYTSNDGTVGADAIDYEICNQCGLCSTGTVTIDIPNQAPVIAGPAVPFTAAVGQSITIPFSTYLSDANNNLDLPSISVTSGPTSGAPITVDANSDLVVDYSASTFSGLDQFTVRVCDLLGSCAQFTFEVNLANSPPSIAASTLGTTVKNSASIDLSVIISDADGNLDPSSFKIIAQPTSGAVATINGTILTIDYSAVDFSGTDMLTIEACDFSGACSQQDILIEVAGNILVFNGISPNGDGVNDYFELRFIAALEPQNKVSIFNRWGDLVFEVNNYDNVNNRFEGLNNSGNKLASGVYFYRIKFFSGRDDVTGYLTIKQ